MRRFLPLLVAAGLGLGCGSSELAQMAIEAKSQSVEFRVEARGEIIATETISIRIPESVRMQFNLNWLAPEYSSVKQGDVVARFDTAELINQVSWAEMRLAQENLMIQNHVLESSRTQTGIQHETVRVEGETDIAQTFANFDPRYFSRIEIIDAIGDLNYLDVEASYYDWRSDTHQRRTDAETDRIRAESNSLNQHLMRYNTALNMSELTSPADGTFVYAKTPWGRKVSRGQSLYPGMGVGMLPVQDKVALRLYVPKVDALGMDTGQDVRFRVDADVSREFTGKVDTISAIATPRSASDPRKYITVTASVDREATPFLRVGGSLTATIITAHLENSIVVPQQAVFTGAGDPSVYVVDGGMLEKREVELGAVSPTLVEITAGLELGEVVSMVAPPTSDA